MPRKKNAPEQPPFYDPFNLSNEPKPPTEETMSQYNEYITRLRNPKRPPYQNPYQWKAGNLTKVSLYLSHPSREGLYKLARTFNYGHDQSTARQANISSFLRSLADPLVEWTDERPEQLRSLDHDIITNGGVPLWIDPDEHYPRINAQFFLTNTIKDIFYKFALSFMIFPPNHIKALPVGPTLSMLFEVIGRNLLVPHNVPMNPNPAKKYYPPQKHLYDYSI
jgi:hypothetical protein